MVVVVVVVMVVVVVVDCNERILIWIAAATTDHNQKNTESVDSKEKAGRWLRWLRLALASSYWCRLLALLFHFEGPYYILQSCR
jgi:hypothetical protein